MTTEKTFYQQGSVTITSARAVLGGKTYAMSNITSVTLTTKPAKKLLPAVLLIGGIALALVSLIDLESLFMCGGIGTAMALIGGGLLIGIKPTYIVKIGSASGETDALSSPKKEAMTPIVNAINEAIIARG